jgi:hypothetical protein
MYGQMMQCSPVTSAMASSVANVANGAKLAADTAVGGQRAYFKVLVGCIDVMI